MGGFELVCDASCQVGESPVWLPSEERLLFIDVKGRRLHRFDPRAGTLSSLALDEDIGFVAPASGGGYLAGLRTGIWLLDEHGRKRRRLADNPVDPQTVRFNDGGTDPRGRLLIGTIDETKREGRAGLYRLGADGLTEVASGLMTSNGVAFAPDGRTLYHSDTPRFVIYRCDYSPETGEVSGRRVFAQLDSQAPDRGRPDGAAVDAAGRYWSALYEGSRVNCYDPSGRLLAEYTVPARAPTMPAFGDADLRTLYVTTARAADGSGGSLYALRVEIPGLTRPAFDEESLRP
ncbi:MAG: SMP-30/gluconolactonase/LRE family protein [Gammaproteobacteria bacterium]|nr:SMP-30/gluconolactonase/LRE family protein [Gammaproteobacteria bacterium]